MTEEVSRQTKAKSKKTRTRSFDAVMARRVHLYEPSWENVNLTDFDYNMRLIHAYNWANANFDIVMLKKIALEYLNSDEYAFLKELPDYYFTSVGERCLASHE